MKALHGQRTLTSKCTTVGARFKLHPVAAGCTVLLMASSVLAQQTPTTTDLSTVTITGIRKGIEDAISVKKNSDSIVESVSAEDIGKLPDNSIAESIARLPGLSAQRVAGRAQVISVRGLSPDFATTLLNGREMVSTGDNRSVEFDQYPSELLSGVTIYKTPDAGLIGQGLSGTMDMQTVRPLSFSKRVVAVNARLQDNSLGSAANAKSTGNRFSASFIDQSADRSVGFAIGFAHQESPVAEDQVGFYEPWKTDGRAGVPAGTYITDGVKALRRTGVTKRDGLMATLEVKPDKNWTSTLDAFTSKATQEDTANQFEVNLGGWNGGYDPALLYTGVTVNSNGTLAGGVANNVYPLVRGMYNKRDDKIDAIGWNNKFKLIGIAMNVDASYSKATRNELSLENNTQLAPPPQLDALNLNVVQGGFSTLTPGLNYSDPSTLYLRNTIYGSGYGKVPSVEDELKGFKVAGTVAAPAAISNVFADIELGLNYADRSKHKTQPEGNINVGVQGDTTIASDLQYGLVDLGFAGIGKIPSWNVPGAVGRYMTFAPVDNQPWLVSKAWTVEEKITTTFAKANIDTQMGSVPVRGNVGLQIQSVDQSSKANFWDGTAAAGSEVKPVTDGKTSTDVLPSLNLAFNLGRDQTVRLGLAQQVARPKMQDLTSSIDFGVDTTTGKPGGSGGNARLDPWRANAIDISYEKYFGNKGYVSAAAFYKDLKSYIYKQSRDGYDFSQFTVGNPIATTNFGTYTAPFNGQGGRLSGVELAASLPLGMLTSTLNGFGIQASTSITDSNIKIKDPDSASSVGDGNITLPGLSKNVSNLTFYYEAGGFEARVSQRTRSDFIGEIGNFNGNRTLRYVVGESIVDAQIGYNFTEGNMKGLGLLLQVNNLGDTAYQTYAGTKDRPLEYIKYGRTILFGANYKF